MKKIILALVIISISIMFSNTMHAQVNTESAVTLTQEQLQQLSPEIQSQIATLNKKQEIETKIEKYGKWVGMGKEIGIAVNESLISLTETADKFANTKVGKFTMFIVAYKVIGTDILQLGFGILWIIIILSGSYLIHRKTGTDKRVLLSKKWIPEAKSFERQYKLIEPHDKDSWNATSVVIFVAGMIIAIAIIFI